MTSRRAQIALTIPYTAFRHVTSKAIDAQLCYLKMFSSNGFHALIHGELSISLATLTYFSGPWSVAEEFGS